MQIWTWMLIENLSLLISFKELWSSSWCTRSLNNWRAIFLFSIWCSRVDGAAVFPQLLWLYTAQVNHQCHKKCIYSSLMPPSLRAATLVNMRSLFETGYDVKLVIAQFWFSDGNIEGLTDWRVWNSVFFIRLSAVVRVSMHLLVQPPNRVSTLGLTFQNAQCYYQFLSYIQPTRYLQFHCSENIPAYQLKEFQLSRKGSNTE